jgi:hypothetical protein
MKIYLNFGSLNLACSADPQKIVKVFEANRSNTPTVVFVIADDKNNDKAHKIADAMAHRLNCISLSEQRIGIAGLLSSVMGNLISINCNFVSLVGPRINQTEFVVPNYDNFFVRLI